MSTPYKVVLTVPSLAEEYGGPARTVPALAAALVHAGLDVEVICAGEGAATLAAAARRNGVRVTAISRRSGPQSLLARRFRTAVAERVSASPRAVLHDNGCWTPINHAAATVARELRCPFVVTLRGMLEPWALGQKRAKKKIAWRLYQHRNLSSANVLHATADQEASNLRALGLTRPIVIIPNGTPLPLLRRNFETSTEPSIALFMSRIHPKKGLQNLVEAWSRVRPEGWRLLIAGPDEDGHLQRIRKDVATRGLEEVVDIVGPADERAKWNLFAQADLFVLPTLSENFGVVVAEALASGIPVLTTTGAPWSDLRDRNCGWWVDVGIEPLADALHEATSLPANERARMGARARALAEEKYTWDNIGQQMKAVYAWLVDGESQPDSMRSRSPL